MKNKMINKILWFIFVLPVFASIVLLSGCAKSVIDISTKQDSSTYPMFGGIPSRNFYIPVTISDSIALKWQAETNGSFPGSSVSIHDHYVFLNDLSGRVFCFDMNTGKTSGQLKHKGAVYTTPIIKDFNVIYTYAMNNDEKTTFVVYDFSNGKFISESEDVNGKALTELIKTDEGIAFVTENGRIYKYSFTGEQKFELPTKSYTHSSPSVNKNILVFGNDAGELIGFDLKAEKILYRNKISNTVLAGVSISDTIVYVGDSDGILYAAGLYSGKIHWKYNTQKRIEMVPVFDDKNIFVGNLSGELFSIDRQSGSLNWKTTTDGLLNSSPLVTQNLLVVPDLNRKLHFVNKRDGIIQRSMEFEGRVRLSPVYFDNILFIGYDNGILEAYEFIN